MVKNDVACHPSHEMHFSIGQSHWYLLDLPLVLLYQGLYKCIFLYVIRLMMVSDLFLWHHWLMKLIAFALHYFLHRKTFQPGRIQVVNAEYYIPINFVVYIQLTWYCYSNQMQVLTVGWTCNLHLGDKKAYRILVGKALGNQSLWHCKDAKCIELYEISGFHSSVYVYYGLLGYDTT
jgi:hypothetical protein